MQCVTEPAVSVFVFMCTVVCARCAFVRSVVFRRFTWKRTEFRSFACPFSATRPYRVQSNEINLSVTSWHKYRFDTTAYMHAACGVWTVLRNVLICTELARLAFCGKCKVFNIPLDFFLFADGLITTASSYDVRFEDVFWNGGEGDDESLTFRLKSNARLAAGRETFVKTATVVATVYVDGNSVNHFRFRIKIKLKHPPISLLPIFFAPNSIESETFVFFFFYFRLYVGRRRRRLRFDRLPWRRWYWRK